MFYPTSIDYPYMDRPYVSVGIFLTSVVLLLTHVFEPQLPPGVALDPEAFAPHQLITWMFFHVGPIHLLGNMIFVYIFGRYVEARLGHLKFAAAYLLCGLVSGLCWLAFGDAPAVGSSGAICGLVGFVLAVAPHNKLNMVMIFGARVDVDRSFQIAVGWMIAWWIGWDLFALASGADGGVAIIAHLGGYAAGYGIGFALSRPELEDTPWYVEPPPKPGDRTQGKRLEAARGVGGRPAPTRRAPSAPATAEEPRHEVVLRALGADTSPVAVIKLLMRHQGMTPEAAKVVVDGVAAGEAQVVGFETVDAASRFASEGRRLDLGLSLRTAQAPS